MAPFVTSDPLWPSFAAVSITPASGSFNPWVAVHVTPHYVRHYAVMAYGTLRLAVLAVDFTLGRDFSTCVPACGQHVRHRPRPSLAPPVDEADRARIRAQCRTAAYPGRQAWPGWLGNGPNAAPTLALILKTHTLVRFLVRSFVRSLRWHVLSYLPALPRAPVVHLDSRPSLWHIFDALATSPGLEMGW